MEQKRGRGRPRKPREEKRRRSIELWLSPAEEEAVFEAARSQEMEPGRWVRELVVKAAGLRRKQ